MSQQNDVRVVTGATVDKQSIKKAQRSFDDIANAARESAKDIERSSNSVDGLINWLKSLSRSGDSAFRDVASGAKKAQGDVDRLTDSLRRQQEQFDKTSRDVSLAGDVQSNLGAVQGLAGAAGFGGAAGGIGVAGELVALTEELPRLKAAVGGLPATLSSAAAALGPAGLLVAGVAAGAAALVALYKNSIKEQEQALAAFAQASVEYVDFVSSGASYDEAKQQVQDYAEFVDAANREILRLEEEYQNQRFNLLDRFFNSGEQELVDAIKELETESRNADASIRRINEGLAEGEFEKTADSASKLKQETTSATQAFEEATRGANSAETAISSFANSAQSASSKVAESQRNLDRLGRELPEGRSIGSAQRRRSTGGAGAVLGNFGRLGANRSPLTGGTTAGFGQAVALSSGQADEINALRENANRAGEALQDTIRSVNQRVKDSIEDLRIDQQRSIADARRTGDILGIRDITRNAARQAEDINRQAQRDRVRAQEEYQREVMAVEMNGQQQRLQMINNFEQQFTASVQRMTSIGGRGGFSFGTNARS